jgi:hypothetical protein
MNLERYTYFKRESYKEYSFYSEGPRGRVLKVVRFGRLSPKVAFCYNLSFGDWSEDQQNIDDRSITNNGDTEKVLATVAAVVVDFTRIFPQAIIYAMGANPARTRRYQMGINKMLEEIEKIFYVYGRKDRLWETFRKNINYDAFLIQRKEYIILEEQTESYMTSSQKKNETEKKRVYDDRIVYEKDLVNEETDPVVLKKKAMALKMLEESPIPEEILRRIKGF